MWNSSVQDPETLARQGPPPPPRPPPAHPRGSHAVEASVSKGKEKVERVKGYVPVDLATPPSWGHDPLFWCPIKLLACHLSHLRTLHDGVVYALYGRPISQVHLCGPIVSVYRTADFISYEIDDGTAIIPVMYWREDPEEVVRQMASKVYLPANIYQSLIQQDLAIGQVISVIGRVTTFRQRRQITAHTLQVHEDPHAEVLHWLDCIKLHKLVYSQPRKPPATSENQT